MGITLVTIGLPAVIVPVLSRTTVSIRRAFCSASMLRMRIPSLCAEAGADHQGGGNGEAQRTRTCDDQNAAYSVGNVTPYCRDGRAVAAPQAYQPMPVIAAITSTAGTNTAAT